MITFQLPISPSGTLVTHRLDSLEVVQSTTSEPVQTGMRHDTFDSVKGVQVLVQSDLEQGSGSLSVKTGIAKGTERDQNLLPCATVLRRGLAYREILDITKITGKTNKRQFMAIDLACHYASYMVE